MGIFKKSKNSWLCQVTTSEVKIFLIFCYLLAVLVALWTSLSYGISKHHEMAIKLGTYFQCSANGVHDQLDCEPFRREFEDLSIHWLQVLYLVLVAFLSISNLPLVIEYRSAKDIILSTLGRDIWQLKKLNCLHTLWNCHHIQLSFKLCVNQPHSVKSLSMCICVLLFSIYTAQTQV